MDEFITRFTSLLRYIPYIKEEKAKVRRFISSLPLYMRERIEFDNPKTMDKVIRKVRICYQQTKIKGQVAGKRGADKRNNRLAGNGKGSRRGSNRSFAKGPNNGNFQKNSLKTRPTSESRTNEPPGKLDSEVTARPPVQCWGCGRPHYIKNCPQQKGTEQISQIQEASTVGDMGRRATLSYISPKVVEHCKLQAVKFKNPWLVQLATGSKRQVIAKVIDCPLKVAGQPVTKELNVLPLGSYDILIGMDWLEKHWSIVNGKTNTIYYRDELGIQQEMQGIKRPVQIQPVTASQLARCIRKGCQIYSIQVCYVDSKDKMTPLENITIIQEFADVFPEEIPRLLPRRDINFTIELVPGATPV
eukprot:PITA_16739